MERYIWNRFRGAFDVPPLDPAVREFHCGLPGYEVTPLVQGFADLLNQVAAIGYRKWQVNETQSVFGKTFVPFGLNEGKNFMEFDLVYLSRDMLFWGARNVDGRGFDKEENRPTNLQIPLARK